MPLAKANSENTPTVASTARNARIYGSALLPPASTMAVAAPTSAAATTSTRTTLPPRGPAPAPALRSTGGRVPAASVVSPIEVAPVGVLARPGAVICRSVSARSILARSILACCVMPRFQCLAPLNRARGFAKNQHNSSAVTTAAGPSGAAA